MDRIESAIAEVEASVPAQADAPKTETTETPANDTVDGGESTVEEVKPKDEPWPKKAVNTVARLKSDKFKLRMEKDQMAAKYEKEISELRAKAPKEKDFEGKPYEELLDAKVDHRAKIAETEAALERAKGESKEIDNTYSQERNAVLYSSFNAGKEAFPDFQKTMDDWKDKIDSLPAELNPVVIETDNAPQALYSIIKEGLWDEFSSLPPVKAAQMLARHEDKAWALANKPKKESNAPEPMAAAKGTAPGGKSLDRMSYEELKTEFKLY